jgi:cyclopropane fatty-acyl-phospholipid synthase-like methyltransferase
MSQARDIIELLSDDQLQAAGRTAITRDKSSLPARWLIENELVKRGSSTLDFGSGKGKDAATYGWSKYDPVHGPKELPDRKFDNVVSMFVLNVLPKSEEAGVLSKIRSMLKPGGKAYVAVRRDLEKSGETSTGTFQRNVVLSSKSVHKEAGFEIYEL